LQSATAPLTSDEGVLPTLTALSINEDVTPALEVTEPVTDTVANSVTELVLDDTALTTQASNEVLLTGDTDELSGMITDSSSEDELFV